MQLKSTVELDDITIECAKSFDLSLMETVRLMFQY